MPRTLAAPLAAAMMMLHASTSTPPLSTVLFVSGVFDNSYNLTTMQAAAEDIAASNFKTVILAFLHFHADESFYYNDIPLANATFLREAVETIRGSNGTRVLVSIGGAGVDDFDNIHAHWSSFSSSFPSVLRSFGFDGVDLDIEGGTWHAQTMADLVRLAEREGFVLTATPPDISPNAFWTELVNSTRNATTGRSPIAHLQLQLYSSFPVSPAERALEWVRAMGEGGGGGVPAPQLMDGFLLPGFEVSAVPPWAATGWLTAVANGAGAEGAITGAFVYDYAQIRFPSQPLPANETAAAYAAAIAAAFPSGR